MSADEIDPRVTYHGIELDGEPYTEDDRSMYDPTWDGSDWCMAVAYVGLVAFALIGVIVVGVSVFERWGFR